MRSKTTFIYTTALILIGSLAIGCGPMDNNGSQLSKLIQKKDSLKSAKDEIAASLVELEQQITKLDTNFSKKLALVSTMEIGVSKFQHYFTVQGVVETDQNAQIYPEAPARIMSISVKEGQKVSKGQELAKLDDKVLSANIQEVENALDLAEIVYKKQEKLWNEKIGSELQYLEAKNNRDALEKKVATLKSQRAMYTVRAPFAGVVDEIIPKQGEMANPAMAMMRLINLSDLYMKADISESYIGKIKEGDSVTIKFPSLNQSVTTQIDRIGDFINPNNRTFKIKLGLPTSGTDFKPNLLGELSILDFSKDQAVVLPASLVQQTPTGDEFVYLIDENNGVFTAHKTMVETGMSFKGQTMISTGLKGNEVIVVKGARSIKDGEIVKVTNS